MNISWRGQTELMRKLQNATSMVEVDRELQEVGNDLHGKAQRIAPLNKNLNDPNRGNLRRSGYVETLDRHGVEVGFATPYALRQHEDLTYIHVDGESKYLEKPLKQNAERYRQRIADVIRRKLRR